MLRQIHIDKYNKIIKQFKPEIFKSLTILDSKPYNQNVQLYIAIDQQNNYYQVYTTEKDIQESILKDVPFVEVSPKILLMKTEKDIIIVEEKINQNLYQVLLANESTEKQVKPSPYLQEKQAKQIVQQLHASISNYQKIGINYNAINPKNIIRRDISWDLSISGLILKNQKQSPDYYKNDITGQFRHAYALGTLLFKLIFGFVPFEKKSSSIKFSFSDYIKYLDTQQTKKSLKTYYFAQKMLNVSSNAKMLIEQALLGKMRLEQFYNHDYFKSGGLKEKGKEIDQQAKQIKMMSIFGQAHQSQIMAAIEHHKKYAQQKLNSKLIYCQDLSKEEIINHLKKHSILCEAQYDQSFKAEKQQSKANLSESIINQVALPFFYRQDQFDPQTDFPCRQLIKLIDNFKQQSSKVSQNFQENKAAIILYVYPYAIVFQLLKVADAQPTDIQKKILKISDDLLQLSQLYFTNEVAPLHDTELIIDSFDQIKIRFREQINELYKFFLGEAMKNYNIKKDTMSYQERSNIKKLGLHYYRLCLKLMECSLLIRKKGRDLDLSRIETNQRKQIQSDLNHLLKQYFPNKIQLN